MQMMMMNPPFFQHIHFPSSQIFGVIPYLYTWNSLTIPIHRMWQNVIICQSRKNNPLATSPATPSGIISPRFWGNSTILASPVLRNEDMDTKSLTTTDVTDQQWRAFHTQQIKSTYISGRFGASAQIWE